MHSIREVEDHTRVTAYTLTPISMHSSSSSRFATAYSSLTGDLHPGVERLVRLVDHFNDTPSQQVAAIDVNIPPATNVLESGTRSCPPATITKAGKKHKRVIQIILHRSTCACTYSSLSRNPASASASTSCSQLASALRLKPQFALSNLFRGNLRQLLCAGAFLPLEFVYVCDSLL